MFSARQQVSAKQSKTKHSHLLQIAYGSALQTAHYQLRVGFRLALIRGRLVILSIVSLVLVGLDRLVLLLLCGRGAATLARRGLSVGFALALRGRRSGR